MRANLAAQPLPKSFGGSMNRLKLRFDPARRGAAARVA
jgi:hypothetical protein